VSDPEQMDLIEFLAGGTARAAPQPLALSGRAAAATGCVQFEHSGPAPSSEKSRSGAEPNAAGTSMSSYRLLVCLAVISWTERELARRTGRLQTTVRRWTTGRSPVQADVAAWVETLAALHQAHPAPQAGEGVVG